MLSLKERNDRILAERRAHQRAARAKLNAEAAERNQKALVRTRHDARVNLKVQDGCIVVFSDAHFWPDYVSAANKALLKLLPKLKPFALINNGDSFDGASISRFPRIGWDKKPTVKEELETNKYRLREIARLAPKADLVWNLGNHDARFETYVAQRVPEFEGVNGFHLKDHFPDWAPAWATWIGDPVQMVIKHRMRGGKYSAANNTLLAGVSICTGHDHALWEKALTDYNGTRFGVDAGTLADVWGPMFKDYTEDNVVDWQSGFAILHFRNGKFTGSEFVRALPDGRVLFRGDVLKV
jgi:predicted MPP superfamily phosphohydrolase